MYEPVHGCGPGRGNNPGVPTTGCDTAVNDALRAYKASGKFNKKGVRRGARPQGNARRRTYLTELI